MNNEAKIKMEKVLQVFKPILKNKEELYMLKNALELFYIYGVHNK